jgi:hypothetical protein
MKKASFFEFWRIAAKKELRERKTSVTTSIHDRQIASSLMT